MSFLWTLLSQLTRLLREMQSSTPSVCSKLSSGTHQWRTVDQHRRRDNELPLPCQRHPVFFPPSDNLKLTFASFQVFGALKQTRYSDSKLNFILFQNPSNRHPQTDNIITSLQFSGEIANATAYKTKD